MVMEDYDLGKIIKQRRVELKLSPENIANACGVHRSTYNRWENGFTKDIKRSHIDTLSKLLYIPVTVLLGVDDESQVESADLVLLKKDIINSINQINDKNKLENIKKYVEVFGL